MIWTYCQTSCAWWRMSSSYSGCCFPPSSQSPVCPAGWGSPPSPACSRCIPEDRSAGAHLRGGSIDGISSTAGGLAYLTAESSLSSKRCDWATFITEPIKEKLGWNKWERIIFVSNPPSRRTWRGFDTPEHVAPSGCLFIAAQKRSFSTCSCARAYHLNMLENK